MSQNNPPRERAIVAFLVALSLLSYARLYMLRDVYADDNCWVFGMYLSDGLREFLGTGFIELRREPFGIFLYLVLLPVKYFDDPYFIWHSANLIVQVLTPIALYRFAYALHPDRWLAALVAAALVIFPLNHAVPYLTAFSYRLALLLGLYSLYLTDTAAGEGRWGKRATVALIIALFVEYVLIEAAITLEAVRGLILWRRFVVGGQSVGRGFISAMRWEAPFALLSVPLVLYKLLFKPYGIYAGMYATGFSRLFDAVAVEETVRLFTLGQWRNLRWLAAHGHVATAVLALAAAGATAVFVALAARNTRDFERAAPSAPYGTYALVAAAILVPQLGIFFFAGRTPSLGIDSTHAILMQVGYAFVIGLVAHWVLRTALAVGRRTFLVFGVLLSVPALLGTYFNNLNLDLFGVASRQQAEFAKRFHERFPTLPERADFFVDAAPSPYHAAYPTFYHLEDLHATYELEFTINRLYQPPGPTLQRRYRVYPLEEMMADFKYSGTRLFDRAIVRSTHYGQDSLKPRELIVVRYREGRILVNREILEAHPKVVYRALADQPVPAWAAPAQQR
jgi:hypothetical protein